MLVLDFGQRIIAEDGDQWFVVGHDGKLKSLGESLLASPGDGKKDEFDHCITYCSELYTQVPQLEKVPFV